jgi:hypothetical protein
MLHNGWFTEINRRSSKLVKKVSRAKEKSDDDPLGDDVVADGELDEDDADDDVAALDEGGRHSARHGPDKGDI